MEYSLQDEIIASMTAGRLLGWEVILYDREDEFVFCAPMGKVVRKGGEAFTNAETIVFPEITKGIHIKSFGIKPCGSDRVLTKQEFGKIYFADAGDALCFGIGELSFEFNMS